LAAALAESAAGVVALGKDAKAVAAVAESVAIDCVQVANMTDAVLAAQRMAAGAGMVLLSPACSSLDMYRNFTERGEIFARVVHGLSSGVQGEDAC
jgi:UDP-N-acetylmuramoylalanine--D-glutamate ligase